jgi:predicted ATPase/DNA-binding CsgD family transcriptional regulator
MAHQEQPIVCEHALTYWQEGRVQEVLLETAEWYAWLATASTFTFYGSAGPFTARKERAGNRRGGWYWKAYRKRNGKLLSAYLGKSESLTFERLHETAARLNTASDHKADLKRHRDESMESSAALMGEVLEKQVASPRPMHVSRLPTQLTSLVGREQETARVCAQLRRSEVRLLTLVGPGGVGKTRLALAVATELADEYPDGVVFVSLALLRDPHLVIDTLAQALGLPERLFEQVQQFLDHRRLLLLLDNFEQVVSAAGEIERLLLTCPGVKVVVTSRAALRIPGEQEFPVHPLSLPDLRTLSHFPADEILKRYPSLALFVQRAQAVQPAFQLTSDNASILGEICVRLDGLPLALELAATRLKLLSPQALLARLSLALLANGARTLPARHQTLHNTLKWSYDLLSADDQRVFRSMSVFAGGCTLEALEAVCVVLEDRQHVDIFKSVSSLLDMSLIFQAKQQGEEARWEMLETVREYALECLCEHEEMESARRAHALHYLAISEDIMPGSGKEGAQRCWLRRLREEQDNVRVALAFLIQQREGELAVRLSGALWGYWVNRGYFREGSGWLDASLALPHTQEPTSGRARALCGAGDLAKRQGNYEAALAFLQESISGYQAVGDREGLAEALLHLGLSLALSRRFAEARSLIEQSMALSREAQNTRLLGHALDSLARMAWKQGNIEAVRQLSEESFQIGSQQDEIRAQVSPRKLLASVALVRGDYPRAVTLAQELLAISQEVGDRESEFSALYTLGTVALHQGDLQQATALSNRCLDLADEIASRRDRSMALARLGEIAYEQEDYVLAERRYRESLVHAGTFDNEEVVGVALLGLARVAKAERRYWRATHVLGAAEKRINPSIDLDARARVAYERDVASLQTMLGEASFARARKAGGEMRPEQALAVPESDAALVLSRSSLSPDGLTRREVEVLMLVAAGLTDIQVAEKLILSPRTVQGHLRSIYQKISVNSRSAATRYALEQKLI